MLPQLGIFIFFNKIFIVNLINHNLSGIEISAFSYFFIFLGDFFEIISILEVEIGRNGPGILGVKISAQVGTSCQPLSMQQNLPKLAQNCQNLPKFAQR
jgi:hypothetical protein